MERTLIPSILVALLLAVILGAGIGYLFGYDEGTKHTSEIQVASFEECAAAGYPVMESYPEQCRTPEGELFVRDIKEQEPPFVAEPVACPMDAKICPDGTAVGRSGPKCEFPACPGE